MSIAKALSGHFSEMSKHENSYNRHVPILLCMAWSDITCHMTWPDLTRLDLTGLDLTRLDGLTSLDLTWPVLIWPDLFQDVAGQISTFLSILALRDWPRDKMAYRASAKGFGQRLYQIHTMKNTGDYIIRNTPIHGTKTGVTPNSVKNIMWIQICFRMLS